MNLRHGIPGIALVVIASGCARSALIEPSDVTFARATARMERTIAEVDATDASPTERALFVMAEGLYRYRFEAGARGGAAFAAEAAAAVTDFPALQSLAGSLDLADLRVRAVDGAVQVWETLLRRDPHSPLRPLILYRLGWAYRNVGASGLPRDSGDEAFDELLRLDPPPPFVTLVPDARAVATKSKGTAAAWSLVPGLGQMYVGKPVSGSIRLAIALAATAAIVTPIVVALNRSSELSWGNDWPLLAVGVGGLIVLSIDYTSSYEDAMRGVVDWNERAEAAFEDSHPQAP